MPNSECSTVSVADQDQPMTQECWSIPKFMMHLREEKCRVYCDCMVLGDSGYPLKPWLLKPFLNPVSVPQTQYNTAHAITRNVFERCLSPEILFMKFRFYCLRDLALSDLEEDHMDEEPALEITLTGDEDGSWYYI